MNQLGIRSHFLYITFRTKRMNALIRETARRNRFLFRLIGNLGVAFGIGLGTYTIYFLSINLVRFFNRPTVAVPVVPVLPGINVGLRQIPYLLAAIIVALFLHEIAHGIVAWSEGIPIKNMGLFVAVLIPGAFVEPDEQKFAEAADMSKLRVLSSGSLANFATAIICIIVLSNFLMVVSPLFDTNPSGTLIIETIEGGPAEKAGLNVGDIIYEVNGRRTWTLDQFSAVMSEVLPGETIEMVTSIGHLEIKTARSEKRAIIGAFMSNYYHPRNEFLRNRLGRQIPHHLFVSVFWSYAVGLSTAMFNMLPVYPFDGDRFLKVIVEKLAREQASEIRRLYNIAFLGLIAANMMLSFTRFGLAAI